jgi:hypothetical protein
MQTITVPFTFILENWGLDSQGHFAALMDEAIQTHLTKYKKQKYSNLPNVDVDNMIDLTILSHTTTSLVTSEEYPQGHHHSYYYC